MLRFPGRQALRAFFKPLPSLNCSFQARGIHRLQAPFSGPPSYVTLFQRFSSSNPSPLAYFSQMKTEEDIARGKFGPVEPEDYDVLSTGFDDHPLHNEISDLVGIPYLKEATEEEADKVADSLRGFVYGRKFRMILPCVLKIEDKAHWIFFIVAGGSPLTYISAQVAQTFNLKEGDDPWNASIAGHNHPIHLAPSKSHFANVSLLGGDFCHLNRLRPWVHDDGRMVTYYIGRKWDVPPRL